MLTEGIIYHLNADVVGPYSGNKYGMKGDAVLLVADMVQMCIVEKNKIRFPVKTSMLGEVQTNKVEEAKPIINPQPMQTNQSKFRKKVSKPSIHNSKLF